MLDSPRMRVLNAAQMREADGYTINEIGLPSIVLMENAGRQVVAAMEGSFDDLASMRVAVVAGRGNNGGDGFVVARTLLQRQVDVAVFLVGAVADVRGRREANLEMLGRLGAPSSRSTNEQDWELHFSDISDCDLIVDALFGTGLREPLSGMLQTVVADINGSGIPVVSIDLPSGLSADTHELIGDAIEATLTITLAAPKLPLLLPPAERHCGDLVIADIGIPVEVIEGIEGPRIEILTREDMRELITPRPSDAHKGDFGRVLVAAGSRGKQRRRVPHGAGRAPVRGGPRHGGDTERLSPMVAALAPEYMTEPLAEDEDGRVAGAALERVLALEADVIAAGPGTRDRPGPTAFVHGLLERAGATLVLDADALNAFAEDPDRLQGRDGLDVIITPHPGEMARLLGVPVEEVQKDRVAAAGHFAATHRRPRRAERPPHGGRLARGTDLDQPDREPGHGLRRDGRRPDRDDRRVVGAVARRGGRLPAGRLPARTGRRLERGRRGRAGHDGHRHARAPRRCRAGADRQETRGAPR
jgi:ADP-dependent NAD(P)H-hydrate dehydratase / NAD(P)H-hydrate epimerase